MLTLDLGYRHQMRCYKGHLPDLHGDYVLSSSDQCTLWDLLPGQVGEEEAEGRTGAGEEEGATKEEEVKSRLLYSAH